MQVFFCDRCGRRHVLGEKGGQVKRVTFSPLNLSYDLCGDCRALLCNVVLHDFIHQEVK